MFVMCWALGLSLGQGSLSLVSDNPQYCIETTLKENYMGEIPSAREDTGESGVVIPLEGREWCLN
jgi:hypothetical protein